MTREEAHKLIDQIFDGNEAAGIGVSTVTFNPPQTTNESATEEPRVLPEGKRAVRTKTSGDKVYLLDEGKKTRQWVATGEVLSSLGFEQSDVVEIPDTELFKYSMGATLYRVE